MYLFILAVVFLQCDFSSQVLLNFLVKLRPYTLRYGTRIVKNLIELVSK